jgi:hypothetical protein
MRIPDRRLDFSTDYEVINALATSLYNRARREPLGSPGRSAFLLKAIDASRLTLAVDSENVAAHYGLGLAYSEFARDEKRFDPPPDEEWSPNYMRPEQFMRFARQAIDRKRPTESRLQAARLLLWSGIAQLVNGPRQEFYSRLDPLHEVAETLGPAWPNEADPAVRSALARVLEFTHKSLHAMLKPDETAEGRAVAIARKNDPAADQNAQSVVIHPLRRPGAPGLGPAPQEGAE